MKLIVISSPTNFKNELAVLCSLFEGGMECFHVYKPSFSKEEMQNYIQKIPDEYHNKTFIHSDYFKFHSLKEMTDCREKYDYAFLSPIFDSISKTGYKSKFDLQELKNSLLLRRGAGGEVIALGGIDENTIHEAVDLGFDGVAVLGAIWLSEDPLKTFIAFQNSLKTINTIQKEQHV